jgi:hypothetical protein
MHPQHPTPLHITIHRHRTAQMKFQLTTAIAHVRSSFYLTNMGCHFLLAFWLYYCSPLGSAQQGSRRKWQTIAVRCLTKTNTKQSVWASSLPVWCRNSQPLAPVPVVVLTQTSVATGDYRCRPHQYLESHNNSKVRKLLFVRYMLFSEIHDVQFNKTSHILNGCILCCSQRHLQAKHCRNVYGLCSGRRPTGQKAAGTTSCS